MLAGLDVFEAVFDGGFEGLLGACEEAWDFGGIIFEKIERAAMPNRELFKPHPIKPTVAKSKIFYVKKGRIYPRYGKAFQGSETIFIRKDLPLAVKRLVLNHEKYHLLSWKTSARNKSHNWIVEEIKANTYSAIKSPIGFVLCIFMSLSPYRLKFYLNKIILN